jgi:ribosomal protein S13
MRGDVALAELIAAAASDEVVAKMRVADALGALPGIGPKGVSRILEDCAIAPNRRLKGLGARQQAALLAGPWCRGRRP